MAGLINKKACKAWLLEAVPRLRPALKHTRVSAEVYDKLEAALREECRKLIMGQPSIGKTLR